MPDKAIRRSVSRIRKASPANRSFSTWDGLSSRSLVGKWNPQGKQGRHGITSFGPARRSRCTRTTSRDGDGTRKGEATACSADDNIDLWPKMHLGAEWVCRTAHHRGAARCDLTGCRRPRVTRPALRDGRAVSRTSANKMRGHRKAK